MKLHKSLVCLLLSAISISPAFSGNIKPEKLKVISYNIRMGEADDGTNSWKYRYPASAMMIEDQKPEDIKK